MKPLCLLIGLSFLLVSALAAEPEPQDLVAGEDYVPGEVLVKVSRTAHQTLGTEAQVKQLIEGITPGVESVKPIFSVRAGDEIAMRHGLDRWYRITYPADIDLSDLVENLRSSPAVESAERNLIGQLAWMPNDPWFIDDTPSYNKCQWNLYNDDSSHVCMDYRGAALGVDIDAPEAWDIAKGDTGIKIGVIDTGVNYSHEDLASKILDGGYDFVNEDIDPWDDNGHGTLVSGVAAAATDNGLGIAGVCPDCRILPEKAADDRGAPSVDDVAAAIYHARDYGVDVINMSFGFGGDSSPLRDAIDDAHDNGIVLVAAAGNDDAEIMRWPCGYDNVLCVAATNFTDGRLAGSYGSNYGSWVDVAAPGQWITTTSLGGGYGYFHYTSSAAPQVAGEAGLILSKCPTLTKAEVESIIRGNVEPTNSPEYIGTGRINLWYALRSFCEDGTICPGLYECLPGGICKLPCDSIADCSSLGPTYDCLDGYCEDLAGVDIPEGHGEAVSLLVAPDPFVNTTTIRFDLCTPGHISLKVYDVSGRVVRTLASARFEQGPHSVTWNAADETGNRVSSGIYFCRIEAGGTTQTRKMILAR